MFCFFSCLDRLTNMGRDLAVDLLVDVREGERSEKIKAQVEDLRPNGCGSDKPHAHHSRQERVGRHCEGILCDDTQKILGQASTSEPSRNQHRSSQNLTFSESASAGNHESAPLDE